ncbi:MAG TPA: hypothetical protein GX010_02505 [Erysipelotrichaceae bacterium]|nr:hypothetical protein [Erysipelotrichaceae bacterium]
MPPVVIFLIVVAVAAVIALAAFFIYRALRPRLKEEKPSEEEILEDEMKRVLQDVADEKTSKEIINYKQDE